MWTPESSTFAQRPAAGEACSGTVGVAVRLVKRTLTSFFLIATASTLFAGESALTQTFQPLDGLGAGRVIIAPVMCYDWYAHSGWHAAIGLITAKNIPPTNAPKPIEDTNAASACGLSLDAGEDAAGHITVTLDCRALQVPQRLGCTELQIVGATLECLRQVAGPKLNSITIQATLKPNGQEAIQKLIAAFIKHPKDKEFLWK